MLFNVFAPLYVDVNVVISKSKAVALAVALIVDIVSQLIALKRFSRNWFIIIPIIISIVS